MKPRWVNYIPAMAWAALIFFLSSRPTLPDILGQVPQSDKVVHAWVYAVLTALLLKGACGPTHRGAWVWAAAASFYGITDELHQYFVPGRSCDVMDWLADTAGACVCVGLWLRFHGWLPARQRARWSL